MAIKITRIERLPVGKHTPDVKEPEEFVALGLDELVWFWSDEHENIPVFYGNVGDIMQHIEAHGFQFYYVIGTYVDSYKDEKNQTHSIARNSIFKVVKTIIGRTIEESDDLVLDNMKPSAGYALPKIPFSLVKKMDDFFRVVDEKYGTESIVLLTYDTEKADSSGWGILVPDQENTAGDCHYIHESIAGEVPPHVQIVGSAHSHPNMAAYASGTDHNDQASFDGLHITYGWKKSVNGGATEYHIELQMQGHSYTYTPEQIFDSMPVSAPDDEVKEWAEKKVKKKAYQTGTTSYVSGGTSKSSGGGGSTPGAYQFQGPTGWSGNKAKVPGDCPNPQTNTIVGVLSSADEESCPFCDTALIEPDISKRRCLACRMYLILPGETLMDVVKIRELAQYASNEINVEQKPFKPVYFWRRNGNDNDYIIAYQPTEETISSLGK